MLNDDQKKAVEHEFGPCFVSAAPGSGKTRVIVERTVRLIEKGHNPRSILCITFTNKAASEMKERICGKLGEIGQHIYISTFHALCATILRKYGKYLGYDLNTTIIDDDDQENLLKQCARQANYELTTPEIKTLLYQINNLRESLIAEDEFINNFAVDYHARIALDYLAKMRKSKQVDFSGLLSETIRLLKADTETLSKLQHRFDFIQIDETQDTNYAQFKIVELLGSHNNILIVGDLNQSIYSWRGARYANIEEFVANKKAKVIPLMENYRSTPEIVKTASNLIVHNKNRIADEFRTSNPSGEPVECFCLPTAEHEGSWIAQKIANILRSGKFAPQDIAILYRINSMSRVLEQGLMLHGIPYQIIGGFSFYDRTEIKDCVSMLRFLINPFDGMALGRFINKPISKIGETTLGQIELYAQKNNISLLQAMRCVETSSLNVNNKMYLFARCKKLVQAFDFDYKNLNIGEVLTKIIQDTEYDKYLQSKYEEKDLTDRRENIQEFINASALYSARKGNDIANYLTSIALQTSADKDVVDNTVSLMSMHASKGLEFPVVFMPGVEEGQLPHKRALNERDGLEEERRLCYVGMTRAKNKLIISFAASRMQKFRGFVDFQKTQPSRFIKESGLSNHLQIVKAS